MLKEKKELKISMMHMTIVSLIALMVGVCGISKRGVSFHPAFIFAIPLTFLAAICNISHIWVLMEYKFKKKELPQRYWTDRNITSKDDLFGITLILAVLTIIVALFIIL